MNEGKIFIRSATSQDREKLRAMFARSSPQTIYRRFHSPYPEVPEWMVALILGADQHDREILVAVAEEKVVGHAMYARIGSGPAAEMAIVVEDGWQSKGIGKRLLSELAARARRRGIEAFTAEVLATNSAMFGLAGTFSGTRRALEDGTFHVRMPLRVPVTADFAPQLFRRAA